MKSIDPKLELMEHSEAKVKLYGKYFVYVFEYLRQSLISQSDFRF